MRVLVTGAAGLLGREVVALLTAGGWTVRAHDRRPQVLAADEFRCGDLLDAEQAAQAVAGMDAVVHAAALPSPKLGTEQEVFTVNVEAAQRVLSAAGHAGVRRIVHVSSLSALGLAWSSHYRAPREIPVTEQHPFVGEDVYGLSKHLSEVVAQTVARRDGATVASLRFPFLGSGERLHRMLRGVHADPGGFSRGELWGWLDTRDAARAVEAALQSPLTGYQVFNVTAPDTTSLLPSRELVRRYHPTLPAERAPEGFGTLFSTRRAEDLLGFTARYSWRDGTS
ncbi:NAD-dependent epimerase/dehydratase family protein [Streptacidiphilus sp. N1-12]|uniref:NAD-dependent epimerase/dehydratase family protein n=2 Tax=Streptacidiphilus alkalitolerans TaxID=3342712 RepID=A0ABV6V1T5_9ACTN